MTSELPVKRILIADEMVLLREGLVALCEGKPGYDVVAQCGDGLSAAEAIDRLRPDLAVVDLGLPQIHTLELIHRVREVNPRVKLLVLAARLDRTLMLEVLRAGADGFMLKNSTGEQFVAALEQITADGVYISPLLTLDDFTSSRGRKFAKDPIELLSSREYQVFTLLVEGIRAKEIAARLDLSPKTVDSHRASLMRKLDIHDVPGLVKFAINRNLTSVA